MITNSSECAQIENCGDDLEDLLATFQSKDLRVSDQSDENICTLKLITKACDETTVDKIVSHEYGVINKCLCVIEHNTIYNPALLLQCIYLVDAVTLVSCKTCEEIVENKNNSYSVLCHFFCETGSKGKTLVLSIFINVVRQWWSQSDEPLKNMLICAISVLDSADELLVKQALTLTCILADSDIDILKQITLVPKLISKLTHANNDIKLEALKCLKYHMRSTQYRTRVDFLHVIEGGFINHCQCLVLSENNYILEETIRCLKLMYSSDEFLKCFIESNLMKYIVMHLSHDNSRIKYASVHLLSKLVDISSYKQNCSLIKDCLLLPGLVSLMKDGVTGIHPECPINFWCSLSGIFKNLYSCLKTSQETLSVCERSNHSHEAQTMDNVDEREDLEHPEKSCCLSSNDYDVIIEQLTELEFLTHLKAVTERHFNSHSQRRMTVITDFSSIHAEFSSLLQSNK